MDQDNLKEKNFLSSFREGREAAQKFVKTFLFRMMLYFSVAVFLIDKGEQYA